MKASVVVLLVVVLAACGGQSTQARRENEALGNQAGDVPRATREERDWKKAAQGHGAAGAISQDELARLEKLSAPGATLDAGK